MKSDNVKCPLINENITISECVVYSDVATGMLKEMCIPNEFKKNKNWRDICKSCKYHEM